MPCTVLGALAAAASLREVHTAPKPGLVDRNNPGAHSDMDYALFCRSASALAPFWAGQAECGLEGSGAPEDMALLRARGRAMESAMFSATGGVNTHKGLIFALSLLLYGAGRALRLGSALTPAAVCEGARLPVAGCVERELATLRPGAADDLSHGQRLYLEHGITGIRGEAEAGFPSLMETGVPTLTEALAAGRPLEPALLETLLRLMLRTEDTNVIHRRGMAYWQGPYRRLVERHLAEGDPYRGDSFARLSELDRRFSREGTSPGGAADLLTGTLFVCWCGGLPRPAALAENNNPLSTKRFSCIVSETTL
ncbi:MAG: triphosphoribosyl-dephospho-CoA synthase [Synergistales bacterium]|nr:triphosphoribosyl-dephospho-CoA synthase [Synergistales bacterium]